MQIKDHNIRLNKVNSLYDAMLYEGLSCENYDIYFNDHGHPKYVHDEFGGLETTKFVCELMDYIQAKNSANEILRAGFAAFAIPHSEKNCGEFIFDYRGIKHTILKRTYSITEHRK